MGKGAAKTILLLGVILSTCFPYFFEPSLAMAAEEPAPNERSLLEILKDKGVISQEEYEALKAEKREQKPEFSVGYDRGFYIRSSESEHQLKLNGLIRAQFTLFPPDTPRSGTQIQPRVLALVTRAFLFRNFGFQTIINLTDRVNVLLDAFANIHLRPWFQVSVGQFRVPFSREQLVFVNGVDTIERSVIGDAISPSYDIGVAIHGTLRGDIWEYALGAFNGSGRNTFDANDDMDIAGRLVFNPFILETDSVLQYLSLGINFQVGDQPFNLDGGRTRFLTRSDQAVIFNAVTQGFRQRYGFDFRFDRGPFALQGEILYEQQQRERILSATGEVVTEANQGVMDAGDLERFGGYLQLGYFLWGDRNRGIQAVAKYERFRGDDTGEPGDIPSQTLDLYTLGLNWYIRPTIKFQANGILEDLERPASTYGEPDRGNFLDGSPHLLFLSQFQLLF